MTAVEAVELRKLWRAARRSKDERALRLWKQWKQLQKPLDQRVEVCDRLVEFKTELGQWIGSVVEGGDEDEVSASWLKAVGLKGCLAAKVGDAVELVLRSGGVEQSRSCRVVDRADEMGAGSVWLKGWRKLEGQRPAWKQPIVQEDGLTWGSEDVDPLRVADAAACDLWWDQQAEGALVECLKGDAGHLGGLFETAKTAPDERVLGSWCFGRMREAVGKMKAADVVEQTCENNPQWAKDKAEEQVFQAGSLMAHRQAFEEFGADSQVLQWLDQGGYEVKLSSRLLKEKAVEGKQAIGIEKRNGGTARENEDDLRVVIMEVVLKGSYEVVKDRSGLTMFCQQIWLQSHRRSRLGDLYRMQYR